MLPAILILNIHSEYKGIALCQNMLNLPSLLSRSASNINTCISSDQNPSVCKVRLWSIQALKPAHFLKIRIAELDQERLAPLCQQSAAQTGKEAEEEAHSKPVFSPLLVPVAHLK